MQTTSQSRLSVMPEVVHTDLEFLSSESNACHILGCDKLGRKYSPGRLLAKDEEGKNLEGLVRN
jgi:hypothetical protein